jgi:hypothetical protein
MRAEKAAMLALAFLMAGASCRAGARPAPLRSVAAAAPRALLQDSGVGVDPAVVAEPGVPKGTVMLGGADAAAGLAGAFTDPSVTEVRHAP